MKTIHVERTASKGIAIGKAYLVDKTDLNISYDTIREQDITKEISRFEAAVANSVRELEALAVKDKIFDTHLEMIKDITLYDSVVSKIKENRQNAEASLEAAIAELIEIFEGIEDEYMRERTADIRDINERLLCNLQGVKHNPFENMNEEAILVAKDLSPSDTASFNTDYVLGFITQEGGITSHVSILAKGLGIPALVGVKDILNQIEPGDTIIMDAENGKILINPDNNTLSLYEKERIHQLKRSEQLSQLKELPAITKDGRKVSLCANVGSIQDIKKAIECGMDGVGLFRSEFLYMDNTHFPTEEEQYLVYKEAAQLSGPELTIRTLDIGGDKALSYYEFEKEENPFLGWRAIRISLDLKDMFKTQLTAILRASAYGKVRIMFPMIISMEELRMAKELLEECKKELDNKSISYDKEIKVGIMIETPASVLLVEDFAKEVDFFSIGTNDLTQYLLAVDRGNNKISKLYNSFHPAVLRSIRHVIRAGHKNNITVGMCGEFASDIRAAKLLLGLGLDEFSMSYREIPEMKNMIRNNSYEEAQAVAEKVCEKITIREVYEVLGFS
ncbi:phosphoenolpyruvate--protein phosphotransferase [Mobilitalea sibirica]|uniref:Phosphoenolpyruvate-protein phosphotransferase n=1 Tax=Mobilitalea sibirica TaxID=1462919 RepID=A0A8J7HCV2_9FIRM|nr:phosphoenolpyruvate--protein phosphotransferase [Mobilitalea sibirica]MBH1940234.1 phosphoenolpyruvate--protein phosphotransferase [Mobilitalea sibirica]